MGHNTLGAIPGTRSWRNVVALLDGPATSLEIVSANAKAAEADLLHAAEDPVFVEAVRLLLSIPFAARSNDFGQALRDVDVIVPDSPELLDIVVAATRQLDEVRRNTSNRTDLGDLSGRALSATLTVAIGDPLPNLFGSTPDDVKAVARKLSWSKGIAELCRNFFNELVGSSLSYWLDRTLDTHIGPDRRFKDAMQRNAFDAELGRFTTEGTRIIQKFSGGWHGKTLHEFGRVGTKQAAVFGAIALKKVVAELRRRGERDV